LRVDSRMLSGALSVGALLLTCGVLRHAGAVCDVPPAVSGEFRAAQGSLNTPYASPGDVVQIALDGSCDTGGSFVNSYRASRKFP